MADLSVRRGMPLCRGQHGEDRGLPLRLVALSIASLLFAAPSLSQTSFDQGFFSYPNGSGATRPEYPISHPGHGDPFRDFGNIENRYAPGEAPTWLRHGSLEDPYRSPPPNPYRMKVRPSRYPPYPGPDNPGDYFRDPILQPGVPVSGRYGYPDRRAPRGWPDPTASQGYRFRGDERVGAKGWGVMPPQTGYRFRPLSEQERRCMQGDAGWRPYARGLDGEYPYPAAVLPTDKAYGFQHDGWLHY